MADDFALFEELHWPVQDDVDAHAISSSEMNDWDYSEDYSFLDLSLSLPYSIIYSGDPAIPRVCSIFLEFHNQGFFRVRTYA